MSGGSYDYLYMKKAADDIMTNSYKFSVKEMAEDAKADGYTEIAHDMIKHADKMYTMIFDIEKQHEVFQKFMKVYEWWKSEDIDEEPVKKVNKEFLEYKKNNPETVIMTKDDAIKFARKYLEDKKQHTLLGFDKTGAYKVTVEYVLMNIIPHIFGDALD